MAKSALTTNARRSGRWLTSCQLSLVGQQVNLFDASVADNVRLGGLTLQKRTERRRVKHMLWNSLKRPNGFDTQIGPFGNRLSGGQRRALVLEHSSKMHRFC